MDKKVSVRLNSELFAKLMNWRSNGISLSDTVRQALILLPNSPEEISVSQSSIKIKPLQKVDIRIQLKNETEALKALQEW